MFYTAGHTDRGNAHGGRDSSQARWAVRPHPDRDTRARGVARRAVDLVLALLGVFRGRARRRAAEVLQQGLGLQDLRRRARAVRRGRRCAADLVLQHARREARRRSSRPQSASRSACITPSIAACRLPASPRRRISPRASRACNARREGRDHDDDSRLRSAHARGQARRVARLPGQGRADRQHREQVRLHAAVPGSRRAVSQVPGPRPRRARVSLQPVPRAGARQRGRDRRLLRAQLRRQLPDVREDRRQRPGDASSCIAG